MKTFPCILFASLLTHTSSRAVHGIGKLVDQGAHFSMHQESDLGPQGLSIYFSPDDPECKKECRLAALPKDKAPQVIFTAKKKELIAHVGKNKYRAIKGLSHSFKFQKLDLASEKLDWMYAIAHGTGDLEFASNKNMAGSMSLLVPKRMKGPKGEVIVVFDWFAPEMDQAEYLFVRLESM